MKHVALHIVDPIPHTLANLAWGDKLLVWALIGIGIWFFFERSTSCGEEVSRRR